MAPILGAGNVAKNWMNPHMMASISSVGIVVGSWNVMVIRPKKK